MEHNFLKFKKILILIPIFFLLNISQTLITKSYDNLTTHPYLTQTSIETYERETKQKLSREEKDWIIYGSVAEDADPRYINHFYNPKTGKGLKTTELGIKINGKPAKDWAQNQNYPYVIFDYSVGSIFKNYKLGNKKRAFQGIGHILHLIQDMSVPAHTRDDPHPEGDPFESWAENFYQIPNTNLIKITSINNTFNALASYSHDNFFSKDSVDINNCHDCFTIIEKENNKNINYLARKLNNKTYKLISYEKTKNGKLYVFNQQVHKSYWNLLSPKAVGYSAGTIDYFIKKFKKIDEETKEENKNKNILQKTIEKLKNLTQRNLEEINYSFGDIIFPTINTTIKTLRNIAKYNKKNILSTQTQNKKTKEEDKNQNTTSTKNKKQDEGETVHIKHVIDGNTILLEDNKIIRYIGIKTPDLNNSGPEDDECLSWQARLRNMDILNSATTVKLIKDPKINKNKKGMLLRYIYADNVFVNAQLAKEGLAETSFCQPFWKNCQEVKDIKRKNIIIDANKYAQKKLVGIYSKSCSNLAVKNKIIEKDKNNNKENKKISQKNKEIKKNKETIQNKKKTVENKNKEEDKNQKNTKDKTEKNIEDKKNNKIIQNNQEKIIKEIPIKNQNTNKETKNDEIRLYPPNTTTNGSSIYIFSGNGDGDKNINKETKKEEVKKDIMPTINAFFIYNLATTTPTTTISKSDSFTSSSTVGINLQIKNNDNIKTIYYLATSTTSSTTPLSPEISNPKWTTSTPQKITSKNNTNGNITIYLWIKIKNNEKDKITDSTSTTIILDTNSPTTTITTKPKSITNSSNAIFTLTSNENYLHYKYKLTNELSTSTNTTWQNISTSTKYTQTSSTTIVLHNLQDKKYTIYFQSEDKAGNISSTSSYEWLIDTTPPTSSINQLSNSYNNSIFKISWNGKDQQKNNTTTTISNLKQYYIQYQIQPNLNQNISTSTWKYLKNNSNNIFTSTSTVFTTTSTIEMENIIYFRIKSVDNANNNSKWTNPIYTKINKHIVISKIHITDQDDYIELYNPTNNNIDLANENYRIERATKGMSTSDGDPYYYITIGNTNHGEYPGGTIISSKGYYLIVDENASSIYLNRANAIIYSNRNFALTKNNVIYLATDTVSSQNDTDIIDYVGYGDSIGQYAIDQYEGNSPLLNITAHYSMVRKATPTSTSNTLKENGSHYLLGNGYDSNQNGNDFILMEDDIARTTARNIWPEINYNPQNSRKSHLRGPHLKEKDISKYTYTGNIGKIVIGGSNTLYFQDSDKITAISLNDDNINNNIIQDTLWTSNDSHLTLYALSNDESFIYAKYNNINHRDLYAINTQNGNKSWKFSPILNDGSHSAARVRDIHVGNNNYVYFTTGFKFDLSNEYYRAYCLDPNTGAEKFPSYQINAPAEYNTPTAMNKDDVLYVIKEYQGKIIAINPNLSSNWSKYTNIVAIKNPIIDDNGDIYLVKRWTGTEKIIAVSGTTGATKWKKGVSNMYWINKDIMAIGNNNDLLIIDNGTLSSLDLTTGTKNWNYTPAKNTLVNSELVTDKDGYIYISSENKIIVLDKTGNEIYTYELSTKNTITTILIGQNETLILGVSGDGIYIYGK